MEPKKNTASRLFLFGAVLVVGTLLIGPAQAQTYALIGTCEIPQDVAEAEGWDIDPASGNWGGKDESLFAVVWEPGAPDIPALYGRKATCTVPGITAYLPKTVTLHTLNGLANDDFCVYIDVTGSDTLVGCYDETSPTEQWLDTTMSLPVDKVVVGQDVKLTILVTGNAWSGFNTWGQLAIDWIEVRGLEVSPQPGRGRGR